MKHWQLKEHSTICKQSSSAIDYNFCEHNYEQILFYSQGDFYLLTMRNCFFGINKYDDIVDIFNKIGLLKTKLRLSEFQKITDVETTFKDYRLKDIVFKDEVWETNYSYYNNAGKKYSIMSKVSLFDAISFRETDLFYNNYIEMEQYLKSIGLDYLTKELLVLRNDNCIKNPSKKEIILTIDKILENINKTKN